MDVKHLHNRYYAMRHGHSIANEAGLIVSHPDNGVNGYGLSDLGREQVMAAVEGINEVVLADPRSLVIVSSDFRRARETAEIMANRAGCALAVRLDPRLRERFFGHYELHTDSHYPTVWEEDLDAPENPANAVESLWSVSTRAASLVEDLDRQYDGRHIVLVAHGDILQITQCVFMAENPSNHRAVTHLETAEIRLLNASPLHDS